MVLGYCPTISDYGNATGAMPLLYSLRDCVPYSFIGLLVVIWIVLFAGNYFIIKSRTGRAKVLTALLGSTFVMIPLSMMLALAQLVSFVTVILFAFLTIVFFALYETSSYW